MNKLATLIVNVDETTIQREFADIGQHYNSHFFIVDTEGNYVVKPTLEYEY